MQFDLAGFLSYFWSIYHSFPLHFPSFFNQRLRSLLAACCLLVAHHVGTTIQEYSSKFFPTASGISAVFHGAPQYSVWCLKTPQQMKLLLEFSQDLEMLHMLQGESIYG